MASGKVPFKIARTVLKEGGNTALHAHNMQSVWDVITLMTDAAAA
jgi:hypothetical protein